MLAVRKIAAVKGGVSIDEIPLPVPGPGEVGIRVKAAGLCGTDLHLYNWIPAFHHLKVPFVLGHEVGGVVHSVGTGVSRVKPGDWVSLESHISCGTCYACLNDRAHLCENTLYPGVHINGGFASYVSVPEKIVWKTGPAISHEIAAMLEPFGIGVHASLEGTGVAGLNVVVAGCGPIGLMNIIAARAFGANKIIATDINMKRLAVAAKIGADCVIDVSKSDPLSTIRDVTNGRGADVYLEYSGAPASIALAGQAIARGGEIRLVGVPTGDVSIGLKKWINVGAVVRGIHGRRLFSSWLRSIDLIESGKVDLKPLISHVMPLKDALRGFDEAIAGQAVKVLFVPD